MEATPRAFLSSSDFLGVQTPLGLEILPHLPGKTIAAVPLDIESTWDGAILLPYLKFFPAYLGGDDFDNAVFFYSPDFLALLLKSRRKDKKTIVVSPYLLDIGADWLVYYSPGFPTTVSYDLSYPLRSEALVEETGKKADELSPYRRVMVLVPDESFLSRLLYANSKITRFRFGHPIDSNILAVVDKEAPLAASLFLPDSVIDTCRTSLIFDTTMGGYYDRLVFRSKRDSQWLASLASLRSSGFCLRMVTRDNFDRYPEEYPLPEFTDYSLAKRFPDYFPVPPEVMDNNFYGLPLSPENNVVFSLWSGAYPPFSILGPLVLLDNFSTFLFVYPLMVYKSTVSYLAVVEQHYKTFFRRFSGRDSFETLSKIWEIFLEEVGTLTPTYDEVRAWADNNSLSTERLWSALQTVHSSLNVLESQGYQGVPLRKGPSPSWEVRDLAAPIFEQVYSRKRMRKEGVGYAYEGKIYLVNNTLLPSSLGVADEYILGLILDSHSVVAGIALKQT